MRLQGKLSGGGRAELFLTHRVSEGLWQALARPGKRLLPGASVHFEDDLTGEVVASMDERGQRLIQFSRNGTVEGVEQFLEEQGMTPLPPYIAADAERETAIRERYQTVYARHEGSAAAPTAGLHFTDTLLERLRAQGIQIARVTLHVGVGTFRPIITEDIDEHVMHSERVSISDEAARQIHAATGRIIAVGTTSLRALESAAIGPRRIRSGEFETSLYVRPGYNFQIADSLVTNFHMPRSTLLVLVSAFMGREAMLAAYAHALASDYRFLSFGDAMAILSGK
jgi:S-adenosylmethionine:tRNA ribosyltransferase-isomerase